MKPKFTYLYISFIGSLIVLIILFFVFYKRLNSHLKYTREFNNSYSVLISIKGLRENVLRLESSSRGYALSGDSSFIDVFNITRDSIYNTIDSLKYRIHDNTDQMRRFLLMKAMVLQEVNLCSRLLRADTSDHNVVQSLVRRSASLMNDFNEEADQIERAEVKQRDEFYRTREFYEQFFPGYFNTITVWAGIITLVSFYFINREVRMRDRYRVELEKRLQELNQSNSELSQFAYIASHDLQEPLRKIRTFSDKLVYRHQNETNDEVKRMIGRIDAAAKRMQELLHDMLTFTNLINKQDNMSPVDLNVTVSKVLNDFADQSRERHAIITWDKLPEINGYEEQLTLLFKSLIDNSFKFAKDGESPEITIKYALLDGDKEPSEILKGKSFHQIVMKDKGIGFNNEFAEKIFMIFQRLHTQQSGYRGKGIGLAIAQRIMSNHNGIIMARGMINDGATFIMYFPV